MLIDLYATLPKLLHSSLKLAGRIFNHQFFVLCTKLGLKTTTKSWLVDQFIYSSVWEKLPGLRFRLRSRLRKKWKRILNDRTHPLPSYTHDIMSGAGWLRGDSGQKLENWKLENWKLENWKILDQLDSCTLFTLPPPPKFCITIVFDSSWYDRNTLEKLDKKIMQTFGGGRGRKQGTLWSMWIWWI